MAINVYKAVRDKRAKHNEALAGHFAQKIILPGHIRNQLVTKTYLEVDMATRTSAAVRLTMKRFLDPYISLSEYLPNAQP